MKLTLNLLTMGVLASSVWLNCAKSVSPEAGPAEVAQDEERIYIIDRTGKKWDVTHATKVYGFKPSEFQYGLGPFAIRPILEPSMLAPGDSAYPADNATFLVIGTRINGDARAYPLTIMSRHEIVDETFGDIHVAVAY